MRSPPMYIRRHAEKTVSTLSKMFGAVLVAGPRQVGKTTMLERITDGFSHATLDDRAPLPKNRAAHSFWIIRLPYLSTRYKKPLPCSSR